MVTRQGQRDRGEEGSWDWYPKVPLSNLPTTTQLPATGSLLPQALQAKPLAHGPLVNIYDSDHISVPPKGFWIYGTGTSNYHKEIKDSDRPSNIPMLNSMWEFIAIGWLPWIHSLIGICHTLSMEKPYLCSDSYEESIPLNLRARDKADGWASLLGLAADWSGRPSVLPDLVWQKAGVAMIMSWE